MLVIRQIDQCLDLTGVLFQKLRLAFLTRCVLVYFFVFFWVFSVYGCENACGRAAVRIKFLCWKQSPQPLYIALEVFRFVATRIFTTWADNIGWTGQIQVNRWRLRSAKGCEQTASTKHMRSVEYWSGCYSPYEVNLATGPSTGPTESAHSSYLADWLQELCTVRSSMAEKISW